MMNLPGMKDEMRRQDASGGSEYLTKSCLQGILNKLSLNQGTLKFVINFPRSRGDSGALYLQSAPARVISFLGPVWGGAAFGKWR